MLVPRRQLKHEQSTQYMAADCSGCALNGNVRAPAAAACKGIATKMRFNE
jgi:hypothetical protein